MPSVALCSVGAPDPTQGGSGIFNYLIARHLLDSGAGMRAVFRASPWFIDEHIDRHYLAELQRHGLQSEFLAEDTGPSRFALGLDLLLESHQVPATMRALPGLRPGIESADGCLALDLGWAVALNTLDVPAVCLLGDPLQHRWAADYRFSPLDRASWKRGVQLASLRRVYAALRKRLSRSRRESFVLGSFAAHHAAELRAWGIPCEHFRWFVPGPDRLVRPTAERDELRILHLGSLHGTASRIMLRYLEREVIPLLAALRLPIELRFVGKAPEDLLPYQEGDLRVVFAGHVPDAAEEFAAADLFLSPMKYPVGVRTRVLSALAHGVPVVADETAALGLPELTSDVDIVWTSTPQAVADTVQRLWHDRAAARRIGDAGREAWESLYNPAVNIPLLLGALAP